MFQHISLHESHPDRERVAMRVATSRAVCELLEGQRLMTSYIYSGSAGNDTITVGLSGSNYIVTINGAPQERAIDKQLAEALLIS